MPLSVLRIDLSSIRSGPTILFQICYIWMALAMEKKQTHITVLTITPIAYLIGPRGGWWLRQLLEVSLIRRDSFKIVMFILPPLCMSRWVFPPGRRHLPHPGTAIPRPLPLPPDPGVYGPSSCAYREAGWLPVHQRSRGIMGLTQHRYGVVYQTWHYRDEDSVRVVLYVVLLTLREATWGFRNVSGSFL